MVLVPANPKIYHITHWKNLPAIIACGGLWSDAMRIEKCLDAEIVGISGIKERRLKELGVKCHQGTKVGDYVPFYFCPRSIMLYILHMGNRPSLAYREGQGPIVHLVADLNQAVRWADAEGQRWAFSDRNAGTRYASFFKQLAELSMVDWAAVANNDFRDLRVKEGKQAEFLVYDFFPWELVERIGVHSKDVGLKVGEALAGVAHQPAVSVEGGWYF